MNYPKLLGLVVFAVGFCGLGYLTLGLAGLFGPLCIIGVLVGLGNPTKR